MNKKVRFPLISVVGVARLYGNLLYLPRGERERTDISAITGAMKMSLGMNTNWPSSKNGTFDLTWKVNGWPK